MVWKDKRNVNILTNVHSPPAECNLCNEHGEALNLVIVTDHNIHMRCMDKSDRMTNCYCISRQTWEWTKKLFSHLLDLTILNSFIILTSCGSKLSHQQFRLTLVRELIQELGRVSRTQTTWQGRQAPSNSQIKRHDARHNKHWPTQWKRIWCHVCSTKTKETRMNSSVQNAMRCSVLELYHTKLHF
jgi:hypothetical protein